MFYILQRIINTPIEKFIDKNSDYWTSDFSGCFHI